MKKKTDKNSVKKLVRKAGLKTTPALISTLSLMRRTNEPLSTQEIIEELNGKFDQATIYRIIHKLKHKGLINQVDLLHNHAHYELSDRKEHHHIICIKCGTVEDIAGRNIQKMYENILDDSKYFAEINRHSLEFYGLCNKCGRSQLKVNI
ncbi:MAG TPA: transcriptional repressor [Candidatus Paceibacterota bacterium]